MNARDVLFYGQRWLFGTIDGLDFSHWETPGVCGYWSVRQIIAHLASYEEVLVDVLSGFGQERPRPAFDRLLGNPMGFNDVEVAARDGQSPRETLAEFERHHEQVMKLVPTIADEVWRKPGTLPWYGMEYSLDDWMVYQFYGHKREHGAQIMVFRDTLAK
jgi:DinB superfamily